jgi:hypothetical protein
MAVGLVRLRENLLEVALWVIFLCRDRDFFRFRSPVIGWAAAAPAVRLNPFSRGGWLTPDLR